MTQLPKHPNERQFANTDNALVLNEPFALVQPGLKYLFGDDEAEIVQTIILWRNHPFYDPMLQEGIEFKRFLDRIWIRVSPQLTHNPHTGRLRHINRETFKKKLSSCRAQGILWTADLNPKSGDNVNWYTPVDEVIGPLSGIYQRIFNQLMNERWNAHLERDMLSAEREKELSDERERLLKEERERLHREGWIPGRPHIARSEVKRFLQGGSTEERGWGHFDPTPVQEPGKEAEEDVNLPEAGANRPQVDADLPALEGQNAPPVGSNIPPLSDDKIGKSVISPSEHHHHAAEETSVSTLTNAADDVKKDESAIAPAEDITTQETIREALSAGAQPHLNAASRVFVAQLQQHGLTLEDATQLLSVGEWPAAFVPDSNLKAALGKLGLHSVGATAPAALLAKNGAAKVRWELAMWLHRPEATNPKLGNPMGFLVRFIQNEDQAPPVGYFESLIARLAKERKAEAKAQQEAEAARLESERKEAEQTVHAELDAEFQALPELEQRIVAGIIGRRLGELVTRPGAVAACRREIMMERRSAIQGTSTTEEANNHIPAIEPLGASLDEFRTRMALSADLELAAEAAPVAAEPRNMGPLTALRQRDRATWWSWEHFANVLQNDLEAGKFEIVDLATYADSVRKPFGVPEDSYPKALGAVYTEWLTALAVRYAGEIEANGLNAATVLVLCGEEHPWMPQANQEWVVERALEGTGAQALQLKVA